MKGHSRRRNYRGEKRSGKNMAVNRADSAAIDIEGLASSIEEDMAVNGADSVAIDFGEGLAYGIEEDIAVNRADSVEKELADMISNDPFRLPNCCIFRTPNILHRHNPKAYAPDAFSFGPFHHGNASLTDTEKIKKKYLYDLISQSFSPEAKLKDLINSVKEVQTEVRECYSEPFGYDRADEFVKILVIDGCFIIELFRKWYYGESGQKDDPIFTISSVRVSLYHDLMLLENQVPWMVLERLFNETKEYYEPESHDKPLIELALEFFRYIFSYTQPNLHLPQTIEDIKHIPDLIIKWMVSSIKQVERSPVINQHKPCATRLVDAAIKFIRGESKMVSLERGWQHMPSATSLVEAGIEIRMVECKSILDITFKDGVLEIPQLNVDELTETYFRNLISFEQCYPNCVGMFTSYAAILVNLMKTAKDVDIVCEKKIIDNWMSSKDTVSFFNKLYHDAMVSEIYYQSLCKEVKCFCLRRWPRWRAVLVRNYFSSPWAIVSTMAAVILLILSLLQTVYTMKK